MSEDVVEIIEILPETVEISDEELEQNLDIIVINYDSSASEKDNKTNIFHSFKEQREKMAATAAGSHNNKLPTLEADKNHLVIQTNPTSTQNITARISGSKKRRKSRRKKVNTTANSVIAVQMAESPSGFQNKVAKGCSSLEATSLSNQIIKQENETSSESLMVETETTSSCTNSNTAETNVLRNDCISNSSNTNESVATSSTAVSQSENRPSHPKNKDYSKLCWLKPLNSLSSPPHLQLVIMDRSHPDWKIKEDKWLRIEKRLLEALHIEMLRSNNSSIGLFDGAKWQRGIKVIGCHNKDALNFIKDFILNLDKQCTGAKLDVCTMAHFVRQICKVFIPLPVLKTDVVLSLIKLQNPSICCEDWEVLEERERHNGIDLWLSVNEESFAHLRRLRGEIKYGINRIFVNPVLNQNQFF